MSSWKRPTGNVQWGNKYGSTGWFPNRLGPVRHVLSQACFIDLTTCYIVVSKIDAILYGFGVTGDPYSESRRVRRRLSDCAVACGWQ